jgi:hypothetical protein
MTTATPRLLGALLFPGFELLELFGPLELFGHLSGMINLVTVAEQAGPVASAQAVRAVADHGFADAPPFDLILVPGGIGTRAEVDNDVMLDFLRAGAQGRAHHDGVHRHVAARPRRSARRPPRHHQQGRVPVGRGAGATRRVGARSALGRGRPSSPPPASPPAWT